VSYPIICGVQKGAISVSRQDLSDVMIYRDGVIDLNIDITDRVQYIDVEYLLNHGCDLIIIGRGLTQRLDISFDTYKLLLDAKIDFIITDTLSAVSYYHDSMDEGNLGLYSIGALLHAI